MVARAQGENLKIDTSVGYDGYYRPGSWVPVFVTISNQPGANQSLADVSDFTGQLMLTSAPVETGATPYRFLRIIDIPKASSKRYILYTKLPEALSGTPRLVLNSENGKFLREFQLNAQDVAKDSLLLVSVSDTLAQPNFPRMRDRLDFLLYAKITPDALPDHWAAYDSASMLVFPKWPSKGIREEAAAALREWVQMGGTLVFLSGLETMSYTDPLGANLLPVTLNGSGRLAEVRQGVFRVLEQGLEPTAGERSFVIGRATPKPGAETLLAVDGAPLIVRQKYGLGSIVFFANDLQASSLNLEQFLMPAWQAVVPIPNLGDAQYEFPDALRRFQTLTGRAARPPNQFIIILICIVYTLVVGPINFAILARRKKLEWAWFTLPAIVLVFFFLIYGFGRLTKGSSNILREMKVENFRQGSTEGSAVTVTGAFVSNPGRHFFRPVAPNQTISDSANWMKEDGFRISDWNYQALSSVSGVPITRALPVVSFENRYGHIYLSALDMGTYDSRTFISRGPENAKGSLDARIVWDGGRLRGTLTNNMGVDFEKTWIAVGNDARELGPLKNGETAALTEQSVLRGYVSMQPDLSFGNQLPYNSIDIFQPPQNSNLEDDAEVNLYNFSLVLTALSNPRLSGPVLPPQRGAIRFIGYRTEPTCAESSTSIEGDVQSRAVATIVRLEASPPPRSTFTVPNPYLHVRLHTYAEKGANGFQVKDQQFQMVDSVAVFSLELPFTDPHLRITRIQIDPIAKALDSQDFILEIFQYGANPGWRPVMPGREFANEDMAMPVSGRLFLRVASVEKKEYKGQAFGWNQYTTLSSLGVTLRGIIE